jgi:hypothetical protein
MGLWVGEEMKETWAYWGKWRARDPDSEDF